MEAIDHGPKLGRIGAAAALALLLAAAFSPFAELRPNRIVRGESVGVMSSPAALAGLAAAAAAVALSSAASRRTTGGFLPLLPRILTRSSALALLAAPSLTARSLGMARASPGPGFWLAAGGLAIAWRSGAARRPLALALDLVAAASVVAMASAGGLDAFSPYAEFLAQGPRFWAELARHLALSLGAFLTAAAFAVPAAEIGRAHV